MDSVVSLMFAIAGGLVLGSIGVFLLASAFVVALVAVTTARNAGVRAAAEKPPSPLGVVGVSGTGASHSRTRGDA